MKKIKPTQVFRLSDSPYYIDELRHCWQSNDMRKDTDLYDLKNECRSRIRWEFTQ